LRAEVSKEQQLKAAFLYNFTKFIEWPARSFPDESSPIIIGLLDRNPFGDELDQVVKGRLVNGRAIVVRIVHTAEDAHAAHLLFVPEGEEGRLAVVPAGAALVIIGESRDATARGGVITFIHEGDKLRFEINIARAEQRGLRVSAQLQKLAAAVRRQP
jgi:hypothetical protein